MALSSDCSTYKHNVSWEEDYAYVQVMRVGETAYFSGQLSHAGEKPVGVGDFAAQCDATFVNLDKCLAEAGASRNHVVHSEVLVVNLEKNMEVMGAKHKQYFGSHRPACTVWGVPELYLPYQLVEIKLTVRLDLPKDHKTIMNGMSWKEEFGFGQIVVCGSTAEVSGQFDYNDQGQPTGGDDFDAQCEQAFKNIDKRLAEIGATRNQIVHTEVMIVNIRDNMEKFNAAHKKFFGSHRPASTNWGVVGLGMPHMLVEIKFTVRLDVPATPKTFSHGLPWEDAHNYSQVVISGDTAWISGQFAHDGKGNPIGEDDFANQCDATFANLDKCLAAIGATRSQIVSENTMVVGLSENTEKLTAVHKKYFGAYPPASTTWGVTGLGLPYMMIEISFIVRFDAPKKP
ncbi:Endoribonuclease L-PSP [Phytophthora infestans]|uniref:Endoribonuclease L-PSP n=1 Tax=Phytophthora infestans TaxID=4787 RepID=A0A8S9UGI3_PHYIN|nr:Endoribonuclease L-PSP [Phytophthora infestans]